MKSHDITDDTAAQTSNEPTDDDHQDATPLGERITAALTNTDQDDDEPHPRQVTVHQVSRARADNSQADTGTLIAATQSSDHLDIPALLAVSRVNTETAPSSSDNGPTLSTVIDDLFASTAETVSIDCVVADVQYCKTHTLEAINQHGAAYVVRKQLTPTDRQIISNLVTPEGAGAALSTTVSPACDVDHDATVLYVPRRPASFSSQGDVTDDDRAAQYQAFVTNQETTRATITDPVNQFLSYWLPVKMLSAGRYDLTASTADIKQSEIDQTARPPSDTQPE